MRDSLIDYASAHADAHRRYQTPIGSVKMNGQRVPTYRRERWREVKARSLCAGDVLDVRAWNAPCVVVMRIDGHTAEDGTERLLLTYDDGSRVSMRPDAMVLRLVCWRGPGQRARIAIKRGETPPRSRVLS